MLALVYVIVFSYTGSSFIRCVFAGSSASGPQPPDTNARIHLDPTDSKNLQSALNLFNNKFAPLHVPPLDSFDKLPDNVVCRRLLWEKLAYYLIYDYKMSGGKREGHGMTSSSQINYLQALVHSAAVKFQDSPSVATQEFLACVHKTRESNSSKWLVRLKTKIAQLWFKATVASGGDLDHSQNPVYKADIKALNKAYSSYYGVQAAMRKFVITTLQRSAGRSSEVAFIAWHGVKWDKNFQCVFIEVPQFKTFKMKLIAICAGNSRHNDWFLDLGDFLTSCILEKYNGPAEPAWVFPALATVNSPGTVNLMVVKSRNLSIIP